MTTPTPTSEPTLSAPTPAGLPDIASIAALANAMFQAAPGATPLSQAAPAAPTRPTGFNAPPAPGGLPTLGQANPLLPPTSLPATPPVPVTQAAVAQHAAPPSVITPRVLPTAAQTPDAPAVAATVLPALGRNAGPVAGVPEAYAANAPAAAPIPGLADFAVPPSASAAPGTLSPGSPFYFVNGSHGYPQARGATTAAAPQAPAPPVQPSLPTFAGAPLPPTSPAPAPPSSPYYFVGESSAYPAAVSGTPDAPRTFEPLSPRETGRGEGLSGSNQFAPQSPSPAAAAHPLPEGEGKKAQSASAPSYYFTDLSRPHVTGQGHGRDEQRAVPEARPAFDVHAVRRDFPILRERVNGRPLIWFDNAATTQKPQSVIDRIAYFYAHENSNIHRAAHELAARATDAYESARNKVAKFIGASSSEEIIFVRGTTEAINLVAASWGRKNVGEGDEIIVSHLEHHANIVPWQMLCAEKGAKLRVIPVDDSGQVRLDEYQKMLSDRVKIVAVTQVSNALGTVVPVQKIVEMGQRAGARVLIDGAQSVSHLRVNVQTLGADFFVFSGHKIFGPTGIGVVYGKRKVLEDMPPYQGGGNMIQDVTFDKTIYHGPPARFEAGTGNIADAVGLGAALDYVDRIGLENIARYEHELLEYGTKGLCTVPGLRLIGTAKDKTSVMSFILDGHRNEDIGKALNQDGIAVRTGHHCAQPILRRFGVENTVRPSIAFYNTHEEIDTMVAALHRLVASSGQRRG